jgi:hypothetical protein
MLAGGVLWRRRLWRGLVRARRRESGAKAKERGGGHRDPERPTPPSEPENHNGLSPSGFAAASLRRDLRGAIWENAPPMLARAFDCGSPGATAQPRILAVIRHFRK